MPFKKDNVLNLNKHLKSDKMPYIIYTNLESFVKRIDGRANILEKTSTAKLGEDIPCGYMSF